MSQRDGFTGGFFLGVLLGGLVGGTIGAIAASRQRLNAELTDEPLPAGETSREVSEARIEQARRSLEAKIAQLNLAIDDVRQQLSSVNGNVQEPERDA
ncbi:MAG: hypothetical protein HC910_11955 [Spirulinaceae cyanobacterium SM2_1_0]|nr:hypothetical protein [Spirulinaceae cyanobacterium SM2_1_0]